MGTWRSRRGGVNDPVHWVLLRGLTRESRHWGSFPETLKRSLPAASVTAIDLPGTGRERRRVSPMSVTAIARDVLARIEGDERRYVCGLSFGGLVAIEMARLDPKRIRGVALVNASLGTFSPFFFRLRFGSMGRLISALWTRNHLSRETLLYRLTSNRPEFEAACVARWAQIAGESPVSRATFLAQLFAAARYRPKVPPRGVPFLVCASQRDRLVHPMCSERLSWWVSAKYKKHPTAGHDLPLDDPEWLAQVLATWSDGTDSSRRGE